MRTNNLIAERIVRVLLLISASHISEHYHQL
jgi:hypothetical protein